MISLRKLVITSAFALTVSTLAPAKASADWLFTPFIGGTFGGSANITDVGGEFENEFNRKLTYGGSVAYLGGGIVGFEVDFGYSPNFLGADDDDDTIDLIGDGNVTTLMGNLMIAGPKAPLRPYVSGGVGLIKTSIDDPSDLFEGNNNFGFNVGGGLTGFFSDNVGLRGDIRFFRALDNNDDEGVDLSLSSFKFWRGSVGVTFRF
jgi:opacity protein-like surface antigen